MTGYVGSATGRARTPTRARLWRLTRHTRASATLELDTRQVRASTDSRVAAGHAAPPVDRATRETVEKAHRAARNGATRGARAARAFFARALRAAVLVDARVYDAPAHHPLTRPAFLSVPPT